MIKMTITKTVDNINDELKRLNTEIGKLPKQSETRLKETTPIKTGNARRNTVLKNGKYQNKKLLFSLIWIKSPSLYHTPSCSISLIIAQLPRYQMELLKLALRNGLRYPTMLSHRN